MILGIDVSSSITGLTILDNDKIVYCDVVDTKKNSKKKKEQFSSILDIAKEIENKFLEIKNQFNIDCVFIERNLQAFRAGSSSVNAIMTLASINGMVMWIAFKIFNLIPEHISVATARKLCGVKYLPEFSRKESALQHNILNGDIVVEYTKAGNVKDKYYDMSDSIIIARAGAKLNEKRNRRIEKMDS